ncbi:hypothetical protein O181_000789 [Austropuccinia psidii MF-1]|uniref:Uncharacterized protein n=1 Tax=Austropuccinia psidii MF-1 TaxID=1389203 RepID=A0A9Q3B973_9BASI|nr:hypothetical protein [Austropuccinia psidii MF-1]
MEPRQVQVELSGELENKHTTFSINLLIKSVSFKEQAPLALPPMEQNKDKKIKKFIKERRLEVKNKREYLVRYRELVHEDEWQEE